MKTVNTHVKRHFGSFADFSIAGLAVLIAVPMVLSNSRAALGANMYWNGVGAGWDSTANWSTASGATTPPPVAVPGSADVAIFNITTVNSAQTVNLNADQSALGLTFNNTGTTTLQGGGTNRTLTLGTNGITVGVSAGAVTIGNGTNQGVNVTLGGNQSWVVNAGRQLTVNNNITGGANDFYKLGSGTLTINGSNSMPNLYALRGNLVLAGTSNTTVTNAYVTESGIASAGNGPADLTVQNSAVLNVSGAFHVGNRNNAANIGTVTQTGGIVNLTSATAGSIRLGHYSNAKGIYTISGGTLNALNGTVFIGWDGTGVLNVNAGGTVNVKGLNLGSRAGSNTANTQVNLSGGSLNVGSNGISKGTNPVITLNSGTLGALAVWSSSANMTMGGSVSVDTTGGDITLSGVLTGAGGFTKAGSGMLTLSSGSNAYAGATVVSGGTLALTGSGVLGAGNVSVTGASARLDVSGISAGSYTLGASQTLSGNGTFALGAKTLVVDGTIAPGNSPGNLTLSNTLDLNGTYAWELGALSTSNPGTDFDVLMVTAGNVDVTGATMNLSLGSFAPSAIPFWQTTQTWSGILNNTGGGSLTGTFAPIDNTGWSSLGSFSNTYTGNDVNLVWVPVPEPRSLAFIGLATSTFWLYRVRRSAAARY